jgi:hypothetical protein
MEEKAGPSAGRRIAKAFSQIVWGVVLFVALFSMVDWLLTSPESAPQQGALGAMAGARVVIGYVFARAFDRLVGVT